MRNLAETIPADQIERGNGEPVFPALYERLRDFPEVLALTRGREQFGIEKYGQPLMTGDNRDTPVEIGNEQADTLAYLQKWILQHGTDDWIESIMLKQIELCGEILQYLSIWEKLEMRDEKDDD